MSVDRSKGEWGLVARQQAALAGLAQFGLQAGDEHSLLDETMRVVGRTVGSGDIGLFEASADGQELIGRAALHAGHVVAADVMVDVRIPAGQGSLPGYAASLQQVVVTDRLVDDPRFVARAPDFDLPLRVAVAAPISWGDLAWGVLVVFRREDNAFTDDEVQFVQAVAATTGLVLQRGRAEAELRASSLRLDLSLTAGGLGAWSWDIVSGALDLNRSACAVFGIDVDAFSGTIEEFLALVHPEDRIDIRESVARALKERGDYRQQFRVVRRTDGEVRWMEVWGQVLERGGSRHLVGVSSDITDRRRSDEQREALLGLERAARVEAEASRERLAFLAASSARLGASLDPDVAAADVADLCVPAIADVTLIDVVDDGGHLVERSSKGIDADLHAAVRELRERRSSRGGQGGIWNEAAVAASGQALLVANLTDDDYANSAEDDRHLAVYRQAGVRSALIAPLRARNRVIGVLTLLRCGDEAVAYDDDDLAMVEELAARAALAIDNARLFHSRSRVARSLQAALLPPALPHIAGLELAARYQVAEADVAIGGDFYDVMELAAGQWGVVVGDVCGRGPDAAALTGLVRHSVRAAAVRETQPSRVLAQTNAAVLDQIDDAKFCTAAYLRLTPAREASTGSVALLASSAGHPRPVVVRTTGSAEFLECAGTLLGVVPDPELVDVHAELAPGDALVLYTDGVTEARNEGQQFGEERLLEMLGGLAGSTADEIAGGLAAAVDSFRRSASDDTAILVIRAEPVSVTAGENSAE
jgi:PAS domain S-box-containing protein